MWQPQVRDKGLFHSQHSKWHKHQHICVSFSSAQVPGGQCGRAHMDVTNKVSCITREEPWAKGTWTVDNQKEAYLPFAPLWDTSFSKTIHIRNILENIIHNKRQSVPHSQDVKKCKRSMGNCLPIQGSFIHDGPKPETVQWPIQRRTDVFTWWTSTHQETGSCNNKDDSQKRYSDQNISDTKEDILYNLFKWNSRTGKLIDSGKKSEWWFISSWQKVKDWLGRGMREILWSDDPYLEVFIKTHQVYT